MARGEETTRLEAALRRRGTDPGGDAALERELFERYQDTCAVMVLDSVGFTRLTREHGILHFLALVVAMRDLIEPIVQRHAPLAAWSEADNSYAVFPTAEAAVRAAVEVQQGIAAANAPRPEASRLWVCIGVGFGKLLRIGDENVWGDEMNLASKLGEDTADAGEILITEATHAAVAGRLGGVGFERARTRKGGVAITFHRVRYDAAGSPGGAGGQHGPARVDKRAGAGRASGRGAHEQQEER